MAIPEERYVDITRPGSSTGGVPAEIRELQRRLDAHIGKGGNAHAIATPEEDGFMSQSDKEKFDTVQRGATQNQTDEYLLNLANATGELPIARVDGLQEEIDRISGDSAAQLREDLANDVAGDLGAHLVAFPAPEGESWNVADLADPDKGAAMVGFRRKELADAVGSTISRVVSTIDLNILEFEHLVDKTEEPWDWTLAGNAGYASLMAMGGGTLRFPKGQFKVSGNGIQTFDSNSYYRVTDFAVRFVGEGFATRLTRKKDLPTDLVDRSDPSTFHKAVFNLHSSNNEWDNLFFEDAESAFYLGQRHGAPVDSCHVTMNKFSRIWIRNCGLGVHMRSGVGNYYNVFTDGHVWGCQIAEYIDSHPTSATQVIPNNNRNQFRNWRNARCHVGLWLESGDTNQFIGQHNEGCTATPSQNRYPAPTDLPHGSASGIGQITGERATNNQFVACMQEANGTDLINGGIRNSFSGLYGDEITGKVRHIVPPANYQSRTMAVTNQGRTYYFSNPQTDFFLGKTPGVVHTSAATRNFGEQTLEVVEGDSRGKYSARRAINIGPMAASGIVTVSLWPEVTIESSCTCIFDVHIVANAPASNLGYSVRFKATAYRTGTRALSGLHVFDLVTTRAGGTGSDAFGVELIAAGANSRELQLILTAPAREIASCVAIVERVLAK